MFKKILFPTDFSDVPEKAMSYIKQLKEAGGQEVIVLHVINQRIIDGLMRHGMLNNDIAKWKKKAEEVAEEAIVEIRKKLQSAGFTVKSLIRTGFPWREILEVEEEEMPSIIVIGSHGRSNLSDMLLGSVSDRVVRKCQGPVMVVKRDQ